MSKQNQETYTDSYLNSEGYLITVKVKGITEGKYSYDYTNEYVFFVNKHLHKIECIKCTDDKFLDIAFEAARNHVNKLKEIKNSTSLISMIFSKVKTK